MIKVEDRIIIAHLLSDPEKKDFIISKAFMTDELETIRFCVSKMLEVNKLEHGEICASILTGDYDRTEEFERVLTKLSNLK